MVKPLRVVELRIRNVLALRDLTLRPGAVTLVTGKNDVGKTSFLRTLELAFRGPKAGFSKPINSASSDGTAEIQIDLGEIELVRRLTTKEDGSTGDYLSVTRGGADVPKPQSFLDRLLGPLAWNPIRFASLPPREQRAMFLEALALKTDPGEITKLLPHPVELPELDWSRPALDLTADLTQHFYSLRHAANFRRTQIQKTVDELKADLPEHYRPTDPTEKARLLRDLQAHQAATRAREGAARRVAEEERSLATWTANRDAAHARVCEADVVIGENPPLDLAPLATEEAELVRRLEAVRLKIAAGKAQNRRSGEATAARLLAVRAREDAKDKCADCEAALAKAREDLAGLPGAAESDAAERLAKMQAAEPLDAVYRQVAEKTVELHAAEEEWQPLEDTVVALQTTVPKALLARREFPVSGLTMEGDELRLDGIPLSQLSGRDRMRIALTIAMELNSRLRVLCLDGCEALDEPTFNTVVENLRDSEYQLFVSRVTSGPLRINGEEVTQAAK